MAHCSELPIDGDGICMRCKSKPKDEEQLICLTCLTPWHVICLSFYPETPASTMQWECPDCAGGEFVGRVASNGNDLVAAVRAIEEDSSLTEQEKVRRRQELLSGPGLCSDFDSDEDKEKVKVDILDVMGESFKCSFCIQLPERPVTTPCGHNFCLKCFQKWIQQGKHTCAKCRSNIPSKMASQPWINSALVTAIRMAKMSRSISAKGQENVYHFVHNQDRPDKPYTTERAKKAGKANAASGRIFVTIPQDHFGPILAKNDPERNQGVLVGECWDGRAECRQWGVHFPIVPGISGQEKHGAQSVVLSGGYQDDEDHGEWFLYTGSGGRDLSGNKRMNKAQSFDQTFKHYNQALQVSCQKGYPVQVVRSCKEKRSSYAPEIGLRYDGIYRIEKCWRKVGMQGFKVCRYLFVRCDNHPAPWTSDEQGDRPRPLPAIREFKKALDLFERTESPSWDYDEEGNCWKWKKPPTPSRRRVTIVNRQDNKRARMAIRISQNTSVKDRLLKEFRCLLCKEVLMSPITTPCAHNFCKPCLQEAFAGQTFEKKRTCLSGRTLRSQKNIMKCPVCSHDITDIVRNPQVNRELMGAIEKLKCRSETDETNMVKHTEGQPQTTEDSSDTSSEYSEKQPKTHRRKKIDSGKSLSEASDNGKQRISEKFEHCNDLQASNSDHCGSPKAEDGEDTKVWSEDQEQLSKRIPEIEEDGNDSHSSLLHM